jgi:hypothetical protein
VFKKNAADNVLGGNAKARKIIIIRPSAFGLNNPELSRI